MILTRQDLSDEENLRECRAKFERACAPSSLRTENLAYWAEEWGEAALEALENPEVDDEDFRTAEREADEANARAERYAGAIRAAVSVLEKAAAGDGLGPRKINTIISHLENAL